MSTHRAAFDIVNALIVADIGAGGLSIAASDAFLRGGFSRVGDPQRTFAKPYIDMEIATEREVDAMPNNRVDMVLRFHVYTDVNTAYRTTDVPGSQDAVVARLRAVLHGATGATSGGWIPGVLGRVGGQQAPATDTDAHYVETYQLRLSVT